MPQNPEQTDLNVSGKFVNLDKNALSLQSRLKRKLEISDHTFIKYNAFQEQHDKKKYTGI